MCSLPVQAGICVYRCASVRYTLPDVRKETRQKCRTLPVSEDLRSCAVWSRSRPSLTRTWARCTRWRRRYWTSRRRRGMTTITGRTYTSALISSFSASSVPMLCWISPWWFPVIVTNSAPVVKQCQAVWTIWMKKVLRETQTLRAGCSKAKPKIFTHPQTLFPGARDGQNLISWRWSLPSPTDPVWWRSMHAILSYRGDRPTKPQTHNARPLQTGPTTIHCTAKLSAQCNDFVKITVVTLSLFVSAGSRYGTTTQTVTPGCLQALCGVELYCNVVLSSWVCVFLYVCVVVFGVYMAFCFVVKQFGWCKMHSHWQIIKTDLLISSVDASSPCQ